MMDIPVRPDASEILTYNELAYPVRTGSSRLSLMAGYAAECHWHEDLEVLIAEEGEMDYSVNGEIIHLRQGESILVNGGRLHYGFSAAGEECRYSFAVFHPLLFGGTAPIAASLDRLTADASQDWWRFGEDAPDALRCIRRMCALSAGEDALGFQGAAAELLHMALRRCKRTGPADPDWAILRRMTGFIQQNYTERLLLTDIAAAGSVCRSRCCAIFRSKLRTTPNVYLTRYRLSRASELLRTGSSVTAVALACGFQSASYFSVVFSRHYGMPPSKVVQG